MFRRRCLKLKELEEFAFLWRIKGSVARSERIYAPVILNSTDHNRIKGGFMTDLLFDLYLLLFCNSEASAATPELKSAIAHVEGIKGAE